jgi:hypothetical protein
MANPVARNRLAAALRKGMAVEADKKTLPVVDPDEARQEEEAGMVVNKSDHPKPTNAPIRKPKAGELKRFDVEIVSRDEAGDFKRLSVTPIYHD